MRALWKWVEVICPIFPPSFILGKFFTRPIKIFFPPPNLVERVGVLPILEDVVHDHAGAEPPVADLAQHLDEWLLVVKVDRPQVLLVPLLLVVAVVVVVMVVPRDRRGCVRLRSGLCVGVVCVRVSKGEFVGSAISAVWWNLKSNKILYSLESRPK